MKLQQKSSKIGLGFVLLMGGMALLWTTGPDGSGNLGFLSSLLCAAGVMALLAGSWPESFCEEKIETIEDK